MDIELLKSINTGRNRSLDPAFQLASNSVTPMTVGIPLIFITQALIRKDSLSIHQAITVAGTQLLAAGLTSALKYGINRQRPGDAYSFIEVRSSTGGPSFPSGHTSASFALATSLTMVCPKWYVITPAFLWASAVGYSRMDLGCHYPSDVLAGAVIGCGSAFLNHKLNEWVRKVRSKKLEVRSKK